ncbi:MAG: hypothetical protein J7518_11840 [Nocardioidaceae bacterium]|nr:hypothetical protein [Nocardioidaceae bacterium]
MTATFKKTWRREIVSSEGFSVRLVARTALLYKDAAGSLRIEYEPLAGAGLTAQLFSESIPDAHERPRLVVIENIRRAFLFAGWALMVR